MIKKDINYYLEDPQRLLKKKPFTRGGEYREENVSAVKLTTKSEAKVSDLDLYEISQDAYIQEYTPSLHKIKYNKSIPHIAVKIGDSTVNIDDMTITAAYQKVIHAAHVLHLTANPMDFTLCNIQPKGKKNWIGRMMDALKGNSNSEYDDITMRFQEVKQEWLLRNMDSVAQDAVGKKEKLADMGLLFTFDKVSNKMSAKVFSYDEGYVVIPNYNEYGEEIARSLYYKTDDDIEVIDTYDDTTHYRFYKGMKNVDGEQVTGWVESEEERSIHGFPKCPLLYKRGKVAWEYAESTIEMWELMANINAVALKRFGVFGLVLTGQMNKDSFTRDASTLIINLSSDTSAGKQDAKVIEFPEPQKMIEYLDELENKISIFSSVSFITPRDIKNTGSGGNGIFLAMKNDLALATQSVADWAMFTNDMIYLFQAGLSLESRDTNKYMDLKINAKFKAWSLESDATKISNLSMQSKWLSKQSIIERSPDAAPDELERVYNEMILNQQKADADALKAERISRNNNSSLNEPQNKTIPNN